MFADQEDFEENQYVLPPLPTLDFKMLPEQLIKCDILYVSFYGISSIFASSLINTKEPIAKINFQKSKQKSLANVYEDKKDSSVHVIFNEEFEKMKEIHFASFIKKNFEFKTIYIFTSLAKGMLEKDDGISMKYLQTSWGLDLKGPTFEQGLTGPQADLLQYAEINGINAVCFVGIYSDYQINKQTIDDIFGKVKQVLSIQNSFDISKQIKSYNMKKYSNKLYL